jgi:YfiH family protein
MIVSDLLKDLDGVRHGFFTRQGGVSQGIYESLNCGLGSNDRAEDVHENRKSIAAKLGIEPGNLVTVRQAHGSNAVAVETPWLPSNAPEGDAMVTVTRGIALGILTADCTPILFADPEARVIGAAHAGWRGAKTGIIESVIGAMEQKGATRGRICATIGPTISQSAYEVGDEFQTAFTADGGENHSFFATAKSGGKPHFDLPSYCLRRLTRAGLAQVENLGLCTYENESLFFSYRRSVHRNEPDYGRQISAIVLV